MSASPPLSFNPDACLKLFNEQKNDELSQQFLAVLDASQQVRFETLSDEMRYFLDVFIGNLLFFFAKEGYVLNLADAGRFLDHNQTLSNLTALSSFKTTDGAVRVLLKQKQNFFKLLALYSPRNRIRVSRKALFDTDHEWASRWWFAFVGNDYGRCADRNALEHLREHYADIDSRLCGAYLNMNEPYFSVTYIAPESERRVKERINAVLRRDWVPKVRIVNRPAPGKAAVVSAFWFPEHSVYRTNHRYVEALAEEYELTFVDIGGIADKIDTGLFERVVRVGFGPNGIELGGLEDNDLSLVYYPDIGMSATSVFLSNLRLAPVQIMTGGHPVSTFGGEIDYFISGAASEIAADAVENYSERLILIPRIGLVTHKITHPKKPLGKPESPVFVNCPWYAQKTNWEMLVLLRRIREQARKKVVFQLFPASALRNTGLLPFSEAVRETVGEEHVIIQPPLAQPAYFDAIARAHLSVDAFPFGGFNTLIDSLYFGIPFVAFEGRRSFNRFAAAFYRQFGLEDLIATDPDNYVEKVVRLIDDEAWRASLEARIAEIDLDTAAFSVDPAPAFRRAVDFVVANDAAFRRSGDRSPLVFE